MAKVIRKLDPDWRVSNNGTYRPRREFFIAEIQCFTFRPLARGHRQQLFKNACATLFYRLEPIKERAAGERFHFEARDLLRRAEDAKVIARSVASGHLGNVSLAFIPIAAVPIVPVIATKLAKELPDIRIVLNEMMTGEQVERLRTGRVDIGILRRPDSNLPGEQKLLLREPYRLAVHRDHPFATRADLTIQDLDEQDLLMYSPGHGRYGYELLNLMFTTKGVRPNIIQHLGQGISMLTLVNAGHGMALVPEGLGLLRLENVVMRPIALPPEATADYHIVISDACKDDPAVRQVFDIICASFSA